MLVTKSNNTTLADAFMSPLPAAPGHLAAVPPCPSITGAQYTKAVANVVAVSVHGSKPDPVAGPSSTSISLASTRSPPSLFSFRPDKTKKIDEKGKTGMGMG